MPRIFASLILVVSLAFGGCAARPIHPGSADKFDSASYDLLLVYDDGIKSAKTDLAAGTLPETTKPILNKFIDVYNTLDAATRAYHTAALSGNVPSDLLQKMADAEAAAAAGWVEFVKAYPKAGAKQ